MNFYTSVVVKSGKVLFRGIKNGRRVMERIPYSPTIFILSNNKNSEYKTLDGKPLEGLKFDSISEYREFVSNYDDTSNFELYGNNRLEHSFISDTFTDEISIDYNLIKTDYIDIEVDITDTGFPLPKLAAQPITAITVFRNNEYHLFALKDYEKHRDDVVFHKCNDESHLLKEFLFFWQSDYPDIITGWNVQEFDILYLYNRIKNVLGEKEARRLSPWNLVNEKSKVVLFAGIPKDVEYVELIGISVLDYLVLFKKLSPSSSQESYALDHIGYVILGERKLSFEGTLSDLYKNDPQKYYEYNIKDVELVHKLDKKQNLIRLAVMLSYDAKCNFEEVLFQVRMWTQICKDYLKNKKKIITPLKNEITSEDSTYEGAYVKEPIPGMKKDILSIDAESLYPSIIQCCNISPETLVRVDSINLQHLIEGKITADDDLILCGNGARFKKDKQGFFVDLVDHYKIRRKEAKAKMIEYEKLKEETKNKKYDDLIETYNTMQSSYKIALNSLYGAAGSKYFPFYDENLAKAITLTGQYILQYMEKIINKYLNKICETEDHDFCIYEDTDSIYLQLTPIIDKFFKDKTDINRIDIMDKIYDSILDKKIINFSEETTKNINAFRNDIYFKREIIADVGIWTAKKRYILNVYDKEGVRYDKPKITVKGLEVKKSSTPQICKDYLNKAIETIINKKENDLVVYIKECREDYSKQTPENIAMPRSVQNVTKYQYAEKSIPIHVKGSLIYNAALEKYKLKNKYETIKNGTKIKFIYLKSPNPFGSHVISFPAILPKEFDIQKYIDYNLMFEKSFIEPIKIVTNPIGWKTEKKRSLKEAMKKK